MESKKYSLNITNWTLGIYAALICLWTIVWVTKVYVIDPRFVWLKTGAGSFAFWTTAKVFIWILPALWLIRLSGRTLSEVFHFSNRKAWIAWGGGIGFLIALTGFLPKYLNGRSFFPSEFSFALLSVLTVAPIFEEFLIRGAILGNLQKRNSFLTANLLSSLLFIVLHLPGWYFAGSLMENLTKPIGGAFSIFVLGLLFGYAVHRGRSVSGGIIAHFLNNLASLR